MLDARIEPVAALPSGEHDPPRGGRTDRRALGRADVQPSVEAAPAESEWRRDRAADRPDQPAGTLPDKSDRWSRGSGRGVTEPLRDPGLLSLQGLHVLLRRDTLVTHPAQRALPRLTSRARCVARLIDPIASGGYGVARARSEIVLLVAPTHGALFMVLACTLGAYAQRGLVSWPLVSAILLVGPVGAAVALRRFGRV